MPARGAGGAASPRIIRMTDRQLEALALRRTGATFEQVGERLGISRQAAKNLIWRALDRLEAERDELARFALVEELERIDAMLRVAYPLAQSAGLTEETYKGLSVTKKIEVDELRLKAVGRVLALGDQRAKLLGLYAPERHMWLGFGQFSVSVNEAATHAEKQAAYLESAVNE